MATESGPATKSKNKGNINAEAAEKIAGEAREKPLHPAARGVRRTVLVTNATWG
jgi:hypothetical protein